MPFHSVLWQDSCPFRPRQKSESMQIHQTQCVIYQWERDNVYYHKVMKDTKTKTNTNTKTEDIWLSIYIGLRQSLRSWIQFSAKVGRKWKSGQSGFCRIQLGHMKWILWSFICFPLVSLDPRSLGMTLVLHIQSHKQIACKHNGNPRP